MMPVRRAHTYAFAAALVAVLLATWFCYVPGLRGTFLFDDYANLPALGAFGPVDSWRTFWFYLTSGSADPTGRPLALLTFLLDARDWPADAYSFKRTNVLLHMLNGVLLCWLLVKLGRLVAATEKQANFSALLGASLWMLHPFLVSTTLYVVQREAMLPATFILLGLIGFTSGRRMAAQGERAGVFVAAFSILVCTSLAFLSKANGALLPLLAWTVDRLVIEPRQPYLNARVGRAFARMRFAVLVIPCGLLVAYLAFKTYVGFAFGMPSIREWTLAERLLTECRILLDYLGSLWIPKPYSRGLFNDAYPLSPSLFSPITTLLSFAAIAGLLAYAFRARALHPALACAIFFYFGGHLLESTVLPLELYFEHRNYVPAMLMFWPLSLWLCATYPPGTKDTPQPVGILLKAVLSVALVASLGLLTYLHASLWGNPYDQAILWALKTPDSPRAQAYAAQVEEDRGNLRGAIDRLQRAVAANPDDIQLTLNLVGARCASGVVEKHDLELAAVALRTARDTGRLGYEWFERALDFAKNHTCQGLDLKAIDMLLVAASENSMTRKVSGRVQDLLNLNARIALVRNDPEKALTLFNAALDADVRPGAGLAQAAMLASAGYFAQANRHLDHLESIWRPTQLSSISMPIFHQWLLAKDGYWTQEIAHMREQLASDIAAKRLPPAPDSASAACGNCTPGRGQ